VGAGKEEDGEGVIGRSVVEEGDVMGLGVKID
jgi:hypothetical protein